MNERYYFTCPIKAAYMNHEFGVITYIELSINDKVYDKFLIKDWNNRGLELDGKNKYYVAPESEHIFEPKKGDEGRWARSIGAHYANYNGEQWVSAGIEEKLPDIIYRDGKHFFSPKEEN